MMKKLLLFALDFIYNTTSLAVLFVAILSVTSTAQPGTWLGDNVVLMFEGDNLEFNPSCMCYLVEIESSPHYMKFKLEETGPMYNLCYAGSYVADITPTESVCKPCPDETYNPFLNACPYCLVCRTCDEDEYEVTECSRTVDRTCACKPGQSCDSGSLGLNVSTPANVRLSTKINTSSHSTTSSSTSKDEQPLPIKSNQQTTPVITLPSSKCSTCPPCEIGTNWKTYFIVLSIVFGCSVIIFPVLSVLIWNKLRGGVRGYHGVDSGIADERVPMEQRNQNGTTIDDDDIEQFVKEIGKDYNRLGLAFGFKRGELQHIENDHKNDSAEVARIILTKARQKHSPHTHAVFIKAFQKCERQDIADKIRADGIKKGVDLTSADPENGRCSSTQTRNHEDNPQIGSWI